MTQVQKIIKYISLAFAFYIIFLIIYSSLSLLNIFSNITYSKSNDVVKSILKDKNVYNNIDIDISTANLTIKSGDIFNVETNNKYITYKYKNNTLNIKETKHLKALNNSDLIITIPNIISFDYIEIDSGIGNVNISKLNSKKASFDFGAGKVILKNITILNSLELDGGVGTIDVKDSYINNLKLDIGVGKTNINAILEGYSEIDSGIGELNITLLDIINNYQFIIEKGLGNLKINNDRITKNSTIGNGNNKISIDGGIGSINIITN